MIRSSFLSLGVACAAVAGPPIHLTDVTAETGIDVIYTSGRVPTTQIVEAKGGGIALIDYDNDGDLDVFVPNGATMDDPANGPGCRLYENLGGLRFRDATADAKLTFRRWGIGVSVADFDNDGWDDIYVTCYGRNALLRNLGGTFEEVTDAAGVGGSAWSAASAFGDLDGDGDLDLYVANYLDFVIANPPPYSTFKGAPVFTGPRGLDPTPDVLYENLGDGTFRDITESSGCAAIEPGFGLGAVILDFDLDGKQDIYVGNDSTPNFLLRNVADDGLRFEDVGLWSGLATNVDGSEQATMGIAIGDVSANGYPDVFTTNFSNDSNTMHVNKGAFFDDETRRYGLGMVSFPFVGWAAGLYDFDLDGDEDILLFNGHVYPNATMETMDATYDEPPLLFAREGRRFVRLHADSAGPWLDQMHCDRGAAFGDLDADGDVDVVVAELNGPVRVLRNDAAGSWLTVALSSPYLGARVDLLVGDARQTRWIYSGGSFVSASAQEAYFGVPPTVDQVDIVVTWPDGKTKRVDALQVNQRVIIER